VFSLLHPHPAEALQFPRFCLPKRSQVPPLVADLQPRGITFCSLLHFFYYLSDNSILFVFFPPVMCWETSHRRIYVCSCGLLLLLLFVLHFDSVFCSTPCYLPPSSTVPGQVPPIIGVVKTLFMPPGPFSNPLPPTQGLFRFRCFPIVVLPPDFAQF